MTYQNKFVSVIKVNNKVLREQAGEVAIPFGSEYTLAFHNLNSVKAQVNVSIDGQNVSDGWLVIQPNGELNLERSILNHNLNSGNRFRFIERTSNIEEHHGIGSSDGIVRIEYRFEKKYESVQPVIHEHPWYYPIYPYYTINCDTTPTIMQNYVVGGWFDNSNTYGVYNSDGLNQSVTTTSSLGGDYQTQGISGQSRGISGQSQQMNMCCAVQSDPIPAGITVPGSESKQTFTTTYNFACEASEVIVLKLVGAFNNVPVKKPITVNFKPICETCGRVNRATNKFCSECGSSLILY